VVNEYLAIYLNDHLAGSLAAVELLERLEAVYPGTDMARFFASLRNEIVADRAQLQDLMNRLQIAESRPRRASALITNKLTELKLLLDDKAAGPLRMLESLEAVGIGIDGKLALWRALNAATIVNSALRGMLDYERLLRRAREQRDAVEILRLEAARVAFKQLDQHESAPQLH
jgi:hypothetical protein